MRTLTRRVARILLAVGGSLAGWAASAQTAPASVRIGVLTDLSSLYADTNGLGAVLAARMAAEDFVAAGGKVTAEIVQADHQNKPDVGSVIAASGSTRWASTPS